MVRRRMQNVLSKVERGLAERLKRQRAAGNREARRAPNGVQDASVTNIIGACFGGVKEW